MLEIRPDIPIVLCTGFSENIDEEIAREIGLSAFVFKPIFKQKLAEVVRKAIDDQRAR
jgi:CheY-like chemotaxis protein